MDKFREAENNPFDAPVPGQSLTDKPGNYPWEHAPQYTDTAEAADYVWDKLSQPEFAEQVIAMLDAGIPVEAIGRIIIFAGFTEGKWTPDVAFIIAEPVMKMIAAVGIHGNVKKFRMSMQDLTNEKQIFVPDNQPNDNIWFSILKSDFEKYYKSNFNSIYYFVLFDPRIKPDINPLAFLRNNHLNYSITWFLLSLSSAIMILIIRRKHYG